MFYKGRKQILKTQYDNTSFFGIVANFEPTKRTFCDSKVRKKNVFSQQIKPLNVIFLLLACRKSHKKTPHAAFVAG